ncbi:MAG: TRAP transporter substrate-binding protein DctP [Candidatus Tectomicrobia bacterium]|nr:TRAP transporter substrate-binding protein DctP [Candidatus Tectomicrobia bacterium]
MMTRFSPQTSAVRYRWGRILSLVAMLLGVMFMYPMSAVSGQVVIKFATLAPEGTPWMNLMQEMNEEIQRKSNGQVAFRFYPGGVAGDEQDVIRKMRINQLHGGAFSGFGLGRMLPESRVLELPMLFRDEAEADHVAAALFTHFEAAFTRKGYTLLSLSEAGAVYIFSKQALRRIDDVSRAKLWLWQGDTLAQSMFRAFGITPVPLTLPDVLPSLQSGLIDACYGTSLAVLAFQWFTKVQYRLSTPITRVMGAMLVTQQQWKKLSAEQQTLVRDTVRQYAAKADTAIRSYEQKALPLLKSTGIQAISLSADDVTHLQQRSEQLHQELVGKLYSKELLDQVVRLRDAYRRNSAVKQ